MAASGQRQSQQVSFKLCRGKETTVIWHIQGWNCEDQADFQLIKSNTACRVDVGPGVEEGLPGGPTSRLRFYFQDHKLETYEHDTSKNDSFYINNHYLSLYVEELSNKQGKILKYDLKVDLVNDKLQVIDAEVNSIEKSSLAFKPEEKILLKDTFIKLSKDLYEYPNEPVIYYPRPADLRVRLTLIPIFISVDSKLNDDPKADEETSLCMALKNMLEAEERFTDLKLETKDNMTVSGHKFMLSARSPVLRELIEREGKRNDFDGTIKLPTVNGKPLGVIIHWMYTGELQENAGKCMEEVVDAAIKFQLTGLIKILDKKVITVCTPENMFELFKVAKKNGMPKAVADISKFIKENLDD